MVLIATLSFFINWKFSCCQTMGEDIHFRIPHIWNWSVEGLGHWSQTWGPNSSGDQKLPLLGILPHFMYQNSFKHHSLDYVKIQGTLFLWLQGVSRISVSLGYFTRHFPQLLGHLKNSLHLTGPNTHTCNKCSMLSLFSKSYKKA